jgi:hypothetical protein
MFVYLALFLFVTVLAVLGARLLTLGSANNASSLESLLSSDSISDRYRPMERLLRESDWKYLSAQSGLTPARIRKIQAQRRAIFRKYLKSMNNDFSALSLLVRSLMVQSPVDRPDLDSALGRIRNTYYLAVLKIEVRLLAQAAGVPSMKIDISGLTRALDEIGAHARLMQVSADPALA